MGCMIGAAACGNVDCPAIVNDAAFGSHEHTVADSEQNVELVPPLTFFVDRHETTAPPLILNLNLNHSEETMHSSSRVRR